MNRNLLLIGAAIFTWGIGESMFYIFQPIYLQQMGASPIQIGAILGAVGVAQTVMQVPSGYLSDRIGPRPLMWASWVIGLIATLLMAWSGSLGVFVAGMILYGMTMFVNPALSSFYVRVRGKLSVERVFTLMSAVYNLGAVVGPMIGGAIAARSNLQAIYRVSAWIFMLSTILIFLLRKPAAEIIPSHEMGVPSLPLHRNRRYVQFIGLAFLGLFSLYLAQPLTPNYLQNERGLSLETIGQMGSLANLSNTLVMLLFGGMQARVGILAGYGLMALYSLLLWRGNTLVFIAAAYSLVGGFRLTRSMVMAYGRTLVHSRHTGLAFGILEMAGASTLVLAPVLAGFLYDRNPASMYLTAFFLIVLSGVAAVFFFYSKRSLPTTQSLPEEAHEP